MTRALRPRWLTTSASFLLVALLWISTGTARSLDIEVTRDRILRPHATQDPGLAAGAPTFDARCGERGCAVSLVVPAGERVAQATWINAGVSHALEVWGTGTWHGYGIAALHLPSEWSTSAGHIRLQFEPMSEAPARLQRALPQRRAALAAEVAQLVDNPHDAVRFAPVADLAPNKARRTRGFQPSAYPDLEGSAVDYLILTNTAMEATFQTLADWKTRRGVPTVVRTVDFVLANARAGSDQAETLRNFIRDAYERWGIRYVLLGGDTDVLQERYAVSTFLIEPTEIPSDMYFACLDGSWNANGNSVFAEAALGGLDLGDETDLFPELFVARAPVTTLSQAQTFVQKTIGYETPLQTTYQDSLLLLAEVLSPSDYDTTQVILLDGASLTEQLRTNVLPGGATQTRYYETSTSYAGSLPLDKAASLAAMELGPHIVNHMGHGFRFNMSVGDASIVNPEAFALQNGDRAFLLFLLNCTALAYDGNALGEQFVLAPDGGAVAVVGSSREAFPTSSIDYNEDFYGALYAQGKVHLGQAVVESRLPRTIFTFFESGDRWTHFILNALGDPELMMFTGPPDLPVVTHVDTLTADSTSLSVHVEANAVAVDSARVCVWKGDETYAVGWTNASGDVVLPIEADTPGVALLTVSGANLQTYQGTVQIIGATPAHPYVVSATVDDDSTGDSAGNGDAQADAGEDIEWRLQIANNGGMGAAGLVAELTLPGGGDITATVDSVSLGDVAPQDSLGMPILEGVFVLHVDADVADLTAFDITVAFADSTGASLGQQSVPLLVHAPQTELVQLLPAGPTGSFQVVLKNFGSGAQPALTGTLSAVDSTVSVVQGSSTWPAIATGQEVTCSEVLQVTELDTTLSNPMHLELTDAYGRMQTLHLQLRLPTTPAAPVLDASPGPTQMRLTWDTNPDTTLLGYHVFRRLNNVGLFDRVTGDIVRQAYFNDVDLLPSTRYDYQVVAVDSSGTFSDFSPVSTASTNPAQLGSWPMPLGAATSSSVAVGDIDGDGDLEVVTGANYVYAWHHDAQEVRDGDNDALTWGVFNDESFTVTASVALAELDDSSAGLEIIACLWDDNRIFAYDSDGNILSGWPVQPANGGSPGYWAAPTATDLDGDGVAEVLAVSKDGHFYGFDAAGQPLVGGDGSFGVVGSFTRCSPTVANLDADPEREIIVAGNDGIVRVWNHDGSVMTVPKPVNWPVNLGSTTLCSPVVGELDGDPTTSEVIITSENDQLHAFDAQGFALPGYPKTMPVNSASFAPSPALGDLDNDGHMEIVVVANDSPGDQSELRVYDGQSGSLLLQKNIGDRSESSPLIADLDGNGMPDLLVGGEAGLVHAWRSDGQAIDGFPLTVGDFVRSTPTVCDLDGDGSTEILLAGWDRSVYAWDLTANWDADTALWPTYAHDVHRTGSIFTPLPTDSDPTVAAVPAYFAVHANVPNPFNPVTRLRFDLPRDAHVTVQVFDVRGRRLATVLNEAMPAGRHAIPWNGRDDRGSSVASGVYWYRVQAGSEQATRKMVLLR